MTPRHDINHHLTDQLLTAYAAGSLPEAFDLVVATHISMCDECRARLVEFEAVGGEVLELAEEVAMTDGALDATMELIRTAAWAEPARTDIAPGSIFPAPLQAYAGPGPEAVAWRKIGGGVRQKVLETSGGATVRLLHIPAGCAVPDHGHNGTELTLVLQGAFRDDSDRFAAGDIEVANEDLQHTPVAEEGVDCICLAATDAPLAFKALLPRIAGRVVGI